MLNGCKIVLTEQIHSWNDLCIHIHIYTLILIIHIQQIKFKIKSYRFFSFLKSLYQALAHSKSFKSPGVLHWYWEISVSCQFSIFRLFSVLFLSQNQHNKAKLLVFLALTGARPRSQDVCPVVISGQQSQLLLLSLLSALCGYCGAWSLSRYKLVSSE